MSVPQLSELTAAASDRAAIGSIYSKHGVVVVRGLIDQVEIDGFKRAFVARIKSYLEQQGIACADENLDAAYALLCKAAPDAARAMRGLGKDLPEYHRMLANGELQAVLEKIFGHRHLQINYDQCLFRIDRPNDDQYAFVWHQDYPYNLMSMNAVTVWLPLTRVTPDMGPLRVVPGSHHKLLPVCIDEAFRNVSFAKHNTIRLANLEGQAPGFEAAGVDVLDVGPGDVLFFHCLLVHRSGANRSNLSRWVFNARFGDMLDPAVVRRAWTTARGKNPFAIGEFHPEAVVRT